MTVLCLTDDKSARGKVDIIPAKQPWTKAPRAE